MDIGLSGSKILVTGGSKGIGLEIAHCFAREGCDLHLVSRSIADLEAAKEAITKEFDVDVTIQTADLSTPEGVREVVQQAQDVDVLVNNAGSIPQGSLTDLDDAAWREGWELKVFGFINVSREFYGLMRERKNGVIINIIGAAGERPTAGYIAGTSGNAALMGFSRALGGEAADHGVRVIGVNPGPVLTDSHVEILKKRAEAQFGDPQRWEELEIVACAPFGRLASTREIADVVTFLASPRASYVNATVVTVDGGRMGRLR